MKITHLIKSGRLFIYILKTAPVLFCLTRPFYLSSRPCSPPLGFSRELRAMEVGEGGGNLSSAAGVTGGQTAERGAAFKRTISSFVFPATFHLQKSKE